MRVYAVRDRERKEKREERARVHAVGDRKKTSVVREEKKQHVSQTLLA
jgi:hypothetical protein